MTVSTSPVRATALALSVLAGAGALGAALVAPAQAATAGEVATHRAAGAAHHPRPVPARVRAKVAGELARARRSQSRGPRTSGYRPIPDSTVSTNLPSRLEIGGPSIAGEFDTGVSRSTAGNVDSIGVVVLADASEEDNAPYAFNYGVDLPAGQQRFSGYFYVNADAIATLGTGYWITGIAEDNDTTDHDQYAELPVVIKLRSLLGQQVTRDGSTVHVFGSAKSYVGGTEYAPWVGQRVAVQRYTAQGWRNVTVLRTDRRGHVETDLHLPYRASLRLTDADTDTTFGAATAPTTL